MPAEPEEPVGSSASTELLAPRSAAGHGARETVGARPTEPEPEDPCASLAAALEAERAARAGLGQEVVDLRQELARITRELNALRFPEDTPYGAFLASPEAEDITDANLRAAFKALLDDFPVMLRPGEATWIAENSERKDWGAYAYPSEHELVGFLGLERLAAEVPLDKLFEAALWNEEYGPALQAALPPGKRAELQTRLEALLEASREGEDLAWVLERFPSFFRSRARASGF